MTAPKAFDRHRPDSPSDDMVSCHREDAGDGCSRFPLTPRHARIIKRVSRAKLKFFNPVTNLAQREKHVDILAYIIM